MKPSSFAQKQLGSAFTNDKALAIASAPRGVPVRVLVKNTAAPEVRISNTAEDLKGLTGTSQAAFPLKQDEHHAFVLAPEQSLYAIGMGTGAQVAIAVSEALPLL